MVKEVFVLKMNQGELKSIQDHVIIEQPLEIRIRHRGRLSQIAITMRTPGFDIDLASGFLFTEGIVTDISDVLEYQVIDDNVIEVLLKDRANLPDGLLHRKYIYE